MSDHSRWRRTLIPVMVGVLVAALGIAVAVTPRKRSDGPIVDRSGGYQITLPASWVRHGIDTDHPGVLLRADDHAYFGRWPRQWTWVVRWRGTSRSQAAAADAVVAQVRRDGATNVERRMETISGHFADVVSWTNDPPIGWVATVLQLGPARSTAWLFQEGDHFFEVGAGVRNGGTGTHLPRNLGKVIASFKTIPIEGTRHVTASRYHFDIPATWDLADKPDRHGAVAVAVAPGPTPRAWFYIFDSAATPDAAAQQAIHNISAAGGRDLVGPTPARLRGEPALQLDFRYPVSDAPGTFSADTEWFVTRQGTTFILAIGAVDADLKRIGTDIASTVR